MTKVTWKDAPEDHDYPAAASYLSLLAPATLVTDLVARFKRVPITQYKAKDLLCASRLPLLPKDNAHVFSDLVKVAANKHLSPILLVRGDLACGSSCRSPTVTTVCVRAITLTKVPTSHVKLLTRYRNPRTAYP